MKKHEIDFCTGSLWKKIFIYSVPLMFSNILQVIFNMSDIAVVGKFSGPTALGAVGSTSILISLFTGILIGLGSGVNALTALYIGSKNKKNIRETVHTALIICFAFGLLITTLGILFSYPILNTMHTKPELMDGALLYLRVYLLGMPALAVYNFGNAVLSAAGDTKRPLYYLTLAGILNVLLNLFFVIVCNLSVLGVALASIISQYLSAISLLILLFREKESFSLKLSNLKLEPNKAKQILRIGLPTALQFAIFALANLFVQASVNSFDHVMVEGNSAAANADPLVYDMMSAFYTACASFIAQNYGANKKERIMKSFLICLFYSFVMAVLLGVGIYIFRYPFISLFTNDKAVIEAGVVRLSVMALSYGISALMDCPIAASRGLGKSVIPTIIVILGSCVFRIFWVYTVFSYFGSIVSLYLLYAASWLVTAIPEIVYYVRLYKKTVNSRPTF